MRCRKARRKLTESVWAGIDFKKDKELLEHLQNCPSCAHQAHAAKILKNDIESARAEDLEEILSLEALKIRVESQAEKSLQPGNVKEKYLMATMINQFKRSPKFSIGLAGVVFVLILSLIIPIKYDRTVGYEVAFAGVDKNLAMDSDKVNTLLERLGVSKADVDVSDCEQTCKLHISNLKSSDDAQLIVAAFSDIDNVELIKDITPVQKNTSGNIFKLVANRITFIQTGEKDSTELQNIIIQKLGNDTDCRNIIWMTDDSLPKGEAKFNIAIANCDSSSGGITIINESDVDGIVDKGTAIVTLSCGDSDITRNWRPDTDDIKLTTIAPSGTENCIWISDDTSGCKPIIVKLDSLPDRYFFIDGDNLNDETRRLLQSRGIDIEVVDSPTENSLIWKSENDNVNDAGTFIRIGGSEKVLCLLNEGNLDGETLRKLQDRGINLRLLDENGDIIELDGSETGKKSELETEVSDDVMPEGYVLSQNYPNPFNPITKIKYSIPKTQHVRLDVININGQLIRTLVDKIVAPGNYSVEWDATDMNGKVVATGVYFYRFEAGDISQTRKMTLMK